MPTLVICVIWLAIMGSLIYLSRPGGPGAL